MSDDPIAAIEAVAAALRRRDLHVAGTPEQERLRRLIDIARRSGALYVALDAYDRMTLAVRMVLATAGIDVVRHSMLAPGTMIAVEPPDPMKEWL